MLLKTAYNQLLAPIRILPNHCRKNFASCFLNQIRAEINLQIKNQQNNQRKGETIVSSAIVSLYPITVGSDLGACMVF